MALRNLDYDAVVDVAAQPGWVTRALEMLAGRARHWTFISTGAVYADQSTPDQRADQGPLRAPPEPGPERGPDDDASYGPRKVACERAVQEACGDRAAILRPGLVVGPGDPVDRFGYWPLRMAIGGEVLAPGSPDDWVQWLDVRDLAAWVVRLAEDGVGGVFDAVAPPLPRGEFLSRIGAAVGRGTAASRLRWVEQDLLLAAGVQPWMGSRSLPLWVPLPSFAGCMTRDARPSLAAGLVVRDLAETASDSLMWRLAGPRPPPLAAGVSAAQERELLIRHQNPVQP
jgi:nucleoside-diphosphate-sugar epimerase